MEIDVDDVTWCLEQAYQVADTYRQYVLPGDHIPRSVDDLVWVATEILGKQVDLYELRLAPEGRNVQGMYMATATGYKIYLLPGLELKLARFVLCKELFHVLLDKQECRNINIYAHIEEVASTFPVPNAKPNCPAVWEVLAEAAAMEFLFPFSHRLEQRRNGEIDPAVCAARYVIPESHVQSFCTDPAMDYFAEIDRRIKLRRAA